MKRFLLLVALCCSMVVAEAKKPSMPHMYAHRGSWSKSDKGEFIIPENSVAAVTAAARMGYEGIECDVHYTKDGRMVILHDATLNRTCRRADDYSRLKKPVYLRDLTFEELRRDYVLEATDPALRTPVPTLEELLEECKRCGIVPMLHSDLMESYHVAQRMFGNDWICFTGGVEHLKKVREFSDCTILLAINDGTAEENIARLKQIGGHCGISTMNYSLYTPEFCRALTDAGYEVQASIFPAPHEAYAQRNGITYQLTDFSYMPTKRKADYIFRCNVGKLNIIGLGIYRQLPDEGYSFDYGGVVVEIKTRRKSNVEIECDVNGRKYNYAERGKSFIYVGQRFSGRVPRIDVNHSNKGQSRFGVKRVCYRYYEM